MGGLWRGLTESAQKPQKPLSPRAKVRGLRVKLQWRTADAGPLRSPCGCHEACEALRGAVMPCAAMKPREALRGAVMPCAAMKPRDVLCRRGRLDR